MTELDNKPLLLIDVDGVINAMPRTVESPAGYTRMVLNGYRIHIHEDIPEMLRTLEDHYELRFFTLWNHNADKWIAPNVGLGPIGHLPTSWERGLDILDEQGYDIGMARSLMYAKTPILPHYEELEGRAWAWLDDMHGPADTAYLSRHFDTDRFRLITTDERYGLSWGDVGEAIDFAYGLRNDTSGTTLTA